MPMKRIIAFVIFALMIYAGGFFVACGLDGLETANSYPIYLDKIDSDPLQSGQRVTGTVYQQVKCIDTDIVRQEAFGIEFGKPVERRFYLVPLKYEEKAENMKYYVVCLSTPESIEQMEKLGVLLPQPESGDGLEFMGVAYEMSPDMRKKVYGVLTTRVSLVGVDGFLRNPLADYYYARIIPWTVYERRNYGTEWAAIAVGAALIIGGIVPSVLLGLKIHRERY